MDSRSLGIFVVVSLLNIFAMHVEEGRGNVDDIKAMIKDGVVGERLSRYSCKKSLFRVGIPQAVSANPFSPLMTSQVLKHPD